MPVSSSWNGYDTVRFIVNDLFLKGLTDDQIRHQPKEGLNSIAWYLWHTSRWQDLANTLIDTISSTGFRSAMACSDQGGAY